MRITLKLLLFIIFFLIFVPHAFAQENSFITIVNPVRISTYNPSPLSSLKSEYNQIESRDLPATWLVTSDVLNRTEMVQELKIMDKKQEIGIFLEVTPKFAKEAGVTYHITGQWYRATSLFLSGYTQIERRKLIDVVFANFKSKFGYYPKSVGAWWVDSYSLSYMQSKYKITGVLGVSDQYDLDGYEVWGTPWSVPYYPSKLNAAIPAGQLQDKLKVVEFRWAPRDPLNGYKSAGKEQASIYSSQDYERLGFTSDYFKNLISIYAKKSDLNSFGQVTVGLEADYTPDTYSGEYSKWLDIVKDMETDDVVVNNMSAFSKWYMHSFSGLMPTSVVTTEDLLGTPKQVIWFQNPNYRTRFVYYEKQKVIRFSDFRTYPQNLLEPFYLTPNGQYFLSINLPYIIDYLIEKNSTFVLNSGELMSTVRNKSGLELNFEHGQIFLQRDSIIFKKFKVPSIITKSNLVLVSKVGNNTTIIMKRNYPIGPDGVVFTDFSPHIPFAVKSRIIRYKIAVIIVIIILTLVLVYLVVRNKKLLLYISILILLILCGYFAFQSQNKYYISQTEYDALSVLSHFPKGNVLVYDKDCLRCSFVSKYKPAAAAGIKDYVSKYSGMKLVYDFNFQTAASSVIAKKVLSNEKISYVYLTKYENFIESLPYISQDLGLSRVYENANVEIWKLKSK